MRAVVIFMLCLFVVAVGCSKEHASQSDDRSEQQAPIPSQKQADPKPITAPEVQPSVTQPSVTQPSVTQPSVTQPSVNQPNVNQPNLVVPRQAMTKRPDQPEAMAMPAARMQPPQATPEAVQGDAAPTEMLSSSATPSTLANQGVFSDEGEFTRVAVFYGTDRSRVGALSKWQDPSWLMPFAFVVAGFTICLAMLALFWQSQRRMLSVVTVVGMLVTVAAGFAAVQFDSSNSDASETTQTVAVEGVSYGTGRGELERGVCEVTIPKDHRLGKLESPSVLKFEFKADKKKHVTLNSVKPSEASDFHRDLHAMVEKSVRKEVFVFVHGFNVDFENAARRTAQIAYDLQFEGVPIFFSWPSKGELLGYTIDENNVQWATPHLKQFLLEVVEHSGAESVHVVAHSMGNRALTGALKEIAMENKEAANMFEQVVLAAPDIDADVFRRDLAPHIAKVGEQVTLYASSNDRALIASKTVHGYPRAGDSGELLVLVEGIDTIDVSGIDTSLLGHSYYGDSDSILADLFHLLRSFIPADSRTWLTPMFRQGLVYWAFDQEKSLAANAGALLRR